MRTTRGTRARAFAALLATGAAALAGGEVRFDHESVASAPSGQRIGIEAGIESAGAAGETRGVLGRVRSVLGRDGADASGGATETRIEVARVYFRARGEENFLLVPMSQTGGSWKGTLPAPSPGVGAVEYLLLAKALGDENVYRSPVHEIEIEDQGVASYSSQIEVYTELAQVPEAVPGFTDNIVLDIVESAVRYGMVAGVTQQTATGATATTAASGTAASGGIGTLGVVGLGAAAAAGVAVAVQDDGPGNRTPEFAGVGTLVLSVNEGSTGNIGSVRATDPDGTIPQYSLTGADASSFSISSVGTVSVRSSTELDYETRSSYSFSVVASDGSLMATRDVRVEVVDVNEAPEFPPSWHYIRVPEDAQGDIGNPVVATDPDGDRLTYSLRGDDAADFIVDSASGQIAIAEGVALDYETRDRYTFQIVASDGSLSGLMVVDVEVTDVAELTTAEWQALVALYNATGGDNWTNNDNWDVTRPTPPTMAELRDWHGVIVEAGRISALRLGDNNLTGRIPGEISALASLTELYLYQNNLTGPIPPQIGSLGELAALGLSQNRLTGPIPSELGNLTSLEFVALQDNEISGAIPRSLGNLTRLRTQLSLANNRLTGMVPEELGNLVNLTGNPESDSTGGLYLNGNQLHGQLPHSFLRLVNLKGLFWQQDGSPSGVADADVYLCAPTDSDFQRWLLTLTSGGPNCQSNRAPAFADTSTLRLTVSEDTRGSFGAPVTATDPDGDSLTYSLSGADASLFAIDPSTGQLSVAPSSVLNAAQRDGYTFDVVASDGSLTASRMLEISVTPAGSIGDFLVQVAANDLHVDICARDHGSQDGDRIRITVNSSVVFEDLFLLNAWQCVSNVAVTLGSNPIEVFAHNEASPPNTGEVEVRGLTSHKEQYNMNTGDTESAFILARLPDSRTPSDALVKGVQIVSNAGLDGIYTAGETLEVEVSYREPVELSVDSRVWIDVGERTVPAIVAGVGPPSTAFRFRYVVQLGDYDPDGVTVGSGAIATTGAGMPIATTGFGELAIRNAAEHVVDTRAQVAEREVLTDSLAATGRAHMNSVSEVIGQRLRGGGISNLLPVSGRFTPVMARGSTGHMPPSGHWKGRGAPGDISTGAMGSPGAGSGSIGSATLAVAGPADPTCWGGVPLMTGPGCLDSTFGPPGPRSHGGTLPASFGLSLGRGEDASGWALWGATDLQSFGGQASAGRYDGELRSRYVGIDGPVAGGLLAGVAVSRSVGFTAHDYSVGDRDTASGGGSLRTGLTSVYPYLRIDLPGDTEVWAIGGLGSGMARLAREDAEAGARSDLGLRLGTVGLNQGLRDFGRLKLSLTADAGVVRLNTGTADDPVLSELGVSVNRIRLGVEGEHEYVLTDGAVFSPYWRATGRHDGGKGPSGGGLELSAGARYGSSWLEGHVQGRWLAMHSSEGYEERGTSASLRIKPPANGLGLSASLSHHWGPSHGGSGLFWDRDYLTSQSHMGRQGRGRSLDGEIGYGLALRGNATVVTPFTQVRLSGESSARRRAGVRFERDAQRGKWMGGELAVVRLSRPHGDPEAALEFVADWRF